MVILITGKRNAGKTEYARNLINEFKMEGLDVIGLDGDAHRRNNHNYNYDDEGRKLNLFSAAKYAKECEENGMIVIMSFVAPRREWRDEMRKYWKESRVVYIPGGDLWEGTEYEKPTDDELQLKINNDGKNDS